MKKLLVLSLVMVMASITAVQAANTTYSTPLADKISAKEKQLQQQQKARQEAQAKQKADFQKKLEADKKAREDASKARQQKIDQKKKQWNDLISK